MIRPNEANHILKCQSLFHQFIVDMYAKNCEIKPKFNKIRHKIDRKTKKRNILRNQRFKQSGFCSNLCANLRIHFTPEQIVWIFVLSRYQQNKTIKYG